MKLKPTIKFTLLLLATLLALQVNAQIGINQDNSDPDSSAILDVKSSEKGLLMPRLSTEERDAIENPATGLIIYNVQDSCFNYYTGTAWVKDCGRSLETDKQALSALSMGGNDTQRGESIAIDQDNNVIMVGFFQQEIILGGTSYTGPNYRDMFIAKYDQAGNLLWSQIIADDGDDGTHILVDVDAAGNIYLTGTNFFSFPNGSGIAAKYQSAFLIKMDADGNTLWEKKYGFDIGVYPYFFDIDANDNLLIYASFRGNGTYGTDNLSSTNNSAALLKADSDGNWLWGKQFVTDNAAYGCGLGTNAQGEIGITGLFIGALTVGDSTFNSATFSSLVAKFDANGNFLWANQLTSTDEVYAGDVTYDSEGKMIVVGYSKDIFAYQGENIGTDAGTFFLVLQLAADGTLQWSQYGQANNDLYLQGTDVETDSKNNIYLSGSYVNSLIVEGTTYRPTTHAILPDVFNIKYAPTGTIEWVKTGGGASSDMSYDLEINQQDIIYVLGTFNRDATFGDQTLINSDRDDIFLIQYTAEGEQSLNQNNLSDSQDGDTDATNELQQLNLSETGLSISNGNTVNLDNLDAQNLSLSGNTLEIERGTNVDLSAFKDNTDEQQLSIAANSLTISGGNTVNLSGITPMNIANGSVAIDLIEFPDDYIRFVMDGGEKFRVETGRINFFGSGKSVFIGNDAGRNDDMTGNENVFIGELSGFSNISGSRNIALGANSFENSQTGGGNISIGHATLNTVNGAANNIGLGSFALNKITTGNGNIAMGGNAMKSLSNGQQNIAIGYQALEGYPTGGDFNIALGAEAGRNADAGDKNVFLGYKAGRTNRGSSNIFLGSQAGENETGSNKLYIDNTNTTTPLIFGNFSSDYLRINGTLDINNAFTFPTADGAAGTVLQTDGSGTLSWSNLNSFLDNTDEQNLRIRNDSILIDHGTGVDLAAFKDNTDAQNLSIRNDSILIDNGTGIDLATAVNIPDDQSLSISNDSILIENGMGVNLAAFKDNTDQQNLLISNDSILIDNGTGVDLAAFKDNTDEQTLSITDNSLSISDGNAVNLKGLTPRTLTDADGDTSVETEANTDEDQIRFKMSGNEYFRMDKSRLHIINNGRSIFLGNNAGLNDDNTSNENVFIGEEAGLNNETGSRNIAIGGESLHSTQTGSNNVGIGWQSLNALGNSAYNVGLGSFTLSLVTNGSGNVGLGAQALRRMTDGSDNVAIGSQALGISSDSDQNVAIGTQAGFNSRSRNVFIGYRSGFSNTSFGNVFLGYQAGYSETGANKLYIENSNSSTPLVYGDFSTDLLRINGTLDINNAYQFPTTDGSSGAVLQTNGSGTVTWVDLSTYLDNTDEQNLSISNDSMLIENGLGVDLSAFKDNTDTQNLKVRNDSILIDNGIGINLATAINIPEEQSLGLLNDSLLIEGGDGVNLSAFKDSPFQKIDSVQSATLNYLTLAPDSNMVVIGLANDTTDTGVLFEIGKGLDDASRSDAFSVYKDGTVEINQVYKLPNVAGTSGQVLTTDGAGNATWETPSGSALRNSEISQLRVEVDNLKKENLELKVQLKAISELSKVVEKLQQQVQKISDNSAGIQQSKK